MLSKDDDGGAEKWDWVNGLFCPLKVHVHVLLNMGHVSKMTHYIGTNPI